MQEQRCQRTRSGLVVSSSPKPDNYTTSRLCESNMRHERYLANRRPQSRECAESRLQWHRRHALSASGVMSIRTQKVIIQCRRVTYFRKQGLCREYVTPKSCSRCSPVLQGSNVRLWNITNKRGLLLEVHTTTRFKTALLIHVARRSAMTSPIPPFPPYIAHKQHWKFYVQCVPFRAASKSVSG